MIVLLLGSVLLMAAGVSLLALNMLPVGVRTLVIRGVQVGSIDTSRIPSLVVRLLYPLIDVLAPLAARVRWSGYRTRAAIELKRAAMSDTVTVDHLLAMKAVFAVLVPLLGRLVLPMLANPVAFLAAAAFAFFIPDRLVRAVTQARERQILRALPGAVDVLSLSVEAGLEFLTALQRLVERGASGPLRDELSTVLNDTRLGKTRSEALKALAARIEVREVSSFVSVLVQADMLGASIGPVLRQQAERMRVERFQRAEKAGGQATQKIIFPMILFIFPAVLLVILAPVALKFIYE